MMNSLCQQSKPARHLFKLVNHELQSSRAQSGVAPLNQVLYIFLGSGELHSSVPLQRMVFFSCNHWWVVELEILFGELILLCFHLQELQDPVTTYQ